MAAPEIVLNLVETLERNREAYRAVSYNETQLRHESLDPLFMALGWDVNNTAGYAEAYKDVIHEDSLKIAAAAKIPNETTDLQIDRLVYELYELTGEEIKIVEESSS